MSRSLLFVLALTAACSVAAEGITVGAAWQQELDGRFDGAPGGADVDDGWRAHAGWTFHEGWSVEAALIEFGDAACCGPQVSDFGFDTETEGWSVGLQYAFDLQPVQPYVQVGWFDADTEGTATTIAGPRDFDEGESGAMAELGARLPIGERFGIRGGWTWYDFDGGDDGAFHLGAEVRF